MNAAMAEAGVYRLFFALVPPAAVREQMARALAPVWPALGAGVRRVAPARWHLTLAFLGSFSARPSVLVERALVAAAVIDSPPFTLCLDRLGHFGSRTRVLWLGMSVMPNELAALRAQLVGGLQAGGVGVDRPDDFAPHLTVARGVVRPPHEHALAPVVWPVGDFALLLSHQDRAGLAYETLHRWASAAPR
jgi:2'-5' RNA ligase